MTMVDEFFEKGGYNMLLQLEERYSCASICQVPLFYMAKDVSEGPPEQDCFTAAVEEITSQEEAAIVFFVTAMILFAAMLGAFTLCCKDSKEKQEEENNGRRKNYQVEEKDANTMN